MAGACNEYLLSHVEDVMRVTTRAMRSAVSGWLTEERATKEQTLQLLDALHGGAVDGGHYAGSRTPGNGKPIAMVNEVEMADDILPSEELDTADNQECGCLLDTFERIQGGRRRGGLITGTSAEAYALAMKIPLGATPANNTWARAAARGIEDYYAAKGWR